MLVTSIFSFSYNVFKSHLFQGCSQSGLCGQGLKTDNSSTLYSLPKNKIFSESNLKGFSKDKDDSKVEIYYGTGKIHWRKRRICWLPAFSPFPTMFTKNFILRIINRQDYAVKGNLYHTIKTLVHSKLETTGPHSSVVRALDLKLKVVGSIHGLVNLTIINCLSDETLNRGPA